MKWFLLAVPWLLTTVTANDVNNHHLRSPNVFQHRMLQACDTTCPATTNPTIVSCSAPGYTGSGPCYQLGSPTCKWTGAGVRFKNIMNTQTTGEIYLGAVDFQPPRVERDITWVNGCSNFTLTFNAPPVDTLVLGLRSNAPMTLPSVTAVVSAKNATPSDKWNGFSIYIKKHR